MKSILLSSLLVLIFSLSSMAQETKVYIKADDDLGKFYLYIDGKLMNRAPQHQVGILGLDEKPSYKARVIFQDSSLMPILGSIKPKPNKVKLFVLYAGTGKQVKARKASKEHKEAPISGNTIATHHALPQYKGRLGCDYPIEDGVLNQVVSLMTSKQPNGPVQIAIDAVTTQCFTTYQFKQILEALDDDQKRVEVSKAAWYYLYDQENFESKLTDAFTEPGQVSQVLEFTKRNQ